MAEYPIGTAANMVALALAEVGYVEKPTNRVKYNGEQFEHPWCGDFQDWLCKQNNMKMPSQRSTVLGFNKMRDIGRGVSDKPQIGDWVYMGWGAKGAIEHIGLLVGFADATHILTVEGNTSDKNQSNGGMVMLKKRPFDQHIIVFTRPKYVPYKGEYPAVEFEDKSVAKPKKKGLLKK